jgi:hypothetical protein
MTGWPNDDAPAEEEEEELEGEWELDPNDPTHPDYDLSEAAGYVGWEPARTTLLARAGVVLLITLVVVIALVVTIIPRI